MTFRFPRVIAPVLLLVGFCCAPVQAQKRLNGVVVSDHDWATRAGMEVLEQGGNAVDAAVATAFALAVVDPASSGLGGGGVLVVFDAKEKKAHALDFLEVSPAGANFGSYVQNGRFDMRGLEAGGLAVAVPGAVAGLLEALKRFGSLPPNVVMASAIRYAESGFPMTAALYRTLEKNRSRLEHDPHFRRIFARKDGATLPVGEKIRQPELAESLKLIAQRGSHSFYEGTIAQAIVATIKDAGGVLDLDDLKSYKPLWRQPIIGDYRGTAVVTMPPPSSGGVALMETLNVMEGYALRQFPHNSATYLHIVAEALKASLADGLKYAGDPGFTEVAVPLLTSKRHAGALRKSISTARAHTPDPLSPALHPNAGGTNHLGVLDGDGNVVAMGLSINEPFGAKLMVRAAGIILNNSMARFTVPTDGGAAANDRLPNGLKPRKRPVTTMTPTVLIERDQPVLVVGASGGACITSAVLQTILNVLDFEMPLRDAIAQERVSVQQGGEPVVVVEAGVDDKVFAGLEAKGHTVRRQGALGIVQAIRVDGPAIIGASDPRLR